MKNELFKYIIFADSINLWIDGKLLILSRDDPSFVNVISLIKQKDFIQVRNIAEQRLYHTEVEKILKLKPKKN